MTDTAAAPAEEQATQTTETEVSSAEQAVADAVKQEATPEDGLDFVMDKYRKEGRTDNEAALEQAKAYKELQSKFGSFTGAPEEYNLSLPEEYAERINLDDYADDPLMAEFKEVAKATNLNEEGFNKFAELYFKGQLADQESINVIREQEMKLLGANADRRLSNLSDWAKMNLDSESAEAFEASLTSAAAVSAMEAVVAKSRNQPQMQESAPAQTVSKEDLSGMLTAKDEFGAPMMNKPEYAAKVRKMYGQVYGEEPHNVTIGASR